MLLLATTLFLASVALSYADPKVKLGPTTLNGLSIPGLGVEFFGGIPFAEPPLGNLRLKPPVLKTRLSGSTFDATSFKSACLQPAADITGLSEDCLTVNIYRPAGIPHRAKLPVVFWTYGGAFIGGAASGYNASALVAQSVARGTPVIYVNHNYRLGPLGYPQGQEADDKKILNLALKDQLTALEWVQANIDIFGGDKSKVTVFGESAGAIMISTLMLNSPLPKLARAAILESGSAGTSIDLKASQRENVWQVFVSGVPSCASLATSGKTLDCLLKANTSEIFAGVNYAIANAGAFPFNPTLDGPNGLVPDIPSQVYAAGKFAKIPFIAGTNLDEGTVFTDSSDLSENGIRNYFINRYSPPLISAAALNATVDQLLKLYPDVPALVSPYNTGNETFGLPTGFKRESAIMGDTTFQAPRRRLAQAASKFGVPVYGYHFTQLQGSSGFPPFLGVAHTTEIAYVYGTTSDPSSLSKNIMDYWLSFATDLTPNDGKGSNRPVWPQYTPHNQALIDLNSAHLKTIPDTYHKTQIDFINANPLIFHH